MQMTNEIEKQRGITLIALIITIIVLLILAGISINAIVGDNGVTAKAKWSEFVNEYEEVNEKKELYKLSEQTEKYLSKNKKIEGLTEAELIEIYPITGGKINITNLSETLKNTIKEIDGNINDAIIYKVDIGKLEQKTKREYVVNLKTGTLYSIEGEKYKGQVWHTPKLMENLSNSTKDLILSKTNLKISIGQKVNIIAKLGDIDVTTQAKWTSNDINIVEIESKGKIKGKGIKENEQSSTITIDVEYNGQKASCNVTVIDLIEEIYTIEDLEMFRVQVDLENKFIDRTVKLMNDLDFKNENSYESTTSNEYNKYYKTTTTWIPIGSTSSKYFGGTFEGNGYEIKNLYIRATTTYQGLFGYSIGGIFKNIKLYNVDIESTNYGDGALVGVGNKLSISNIKTTGKIEATGKSSSSFSYVAGIVGYIEENGGNIEKCTNEAIITGLYHGTAGIVGSIKKGNIINCENRGKVLGTYGYKAGIVGDGGYVPTGGNISIDNCKNYAEIKGTGSSSIYIGGIAGSVTNGSLITNCFNYTDADISGEGVNSLSGSCIGGIVGNIEYTGNNEVTGCINYAKVLSDYNYCGGIIGLCQNAIVMNCNNYGDVSNKRSMTGGIIGGMGRHNGASVSSSVIQCYNKGTVEITGTGNDAGAAGGIAGYVTNSSYITNSINEGKIIAKGYYSSSTKYSAVGGIAGLLTRTGSNYIEYCYNTGDVEGTVTGIGGIAGYLGTSTSYISYCYSKGIIKGPASIGGILGYRFAGEVGTECCYLENSVISNDGSTASNYGTEKDADAIKSIVTQTEWSDNYRNDVTPNINEGYPILKWQVVESEK